MFPFYSKERVDILKNKLIILLIGVVLASSILSSCKFKHEVVLGGNTELPDNITELPFYDQLLDIFPELTELGELGGVSGLLPGDASSLLTVLPSLDNTVKMDNPDGSYSVIVPNENGKIKSATTYSSADVPINSTIYNDDGLKSKYYEYGKNGTISYSVSYSKDGFKTYAESYKGGKLSKTVSYSSNKPNQIVEYKNETVAYNTKVIYPNNQFSIYVKTDAYGKKVMEYTVDNINNILVGCIEYKNNEKTFELENQYEGALITGQNYMGYTVNLSCDIEDAFNVKTTYNSDYYKYSLNYEKALSSAQALGNYGVCPVFNEKGMVERIFVFDSESLFTADIGKEYISNEFFCSFESMSNGYIFYNELGQIVQKKISADGGYDSIEKIFYYEYDHLGNLINTHVKTVD